MFRSIVSFPKMVFMCVVLAGMYFYNSPLRAQVIMGGGTVIQSDGTKGHFIVGTFDNVDECKKNVFDMVEMIKGQAKWIGQSFSYKLADCAENFQNGSVFEALANLNGLKHYTLIHRHFRMVLVSPDGSEEELSLCKTLKDYFESLLGQGAVCAAPR